MPGMSRRLVPVLLLALVALTALGASSALGALKGFQTPTRNIGCLLADGRLRCDIGEHTASIPFRKPSGCPLEWGDSLQMTARSRPSGVCHGDTVLRQGQVVRYGRTWHAGGFTCTVRQSGVTCRNRAGHGWFLSRQRISVS
jgi:hypothetical protein